MAQHTYSPTLAARNAKKERTLDHIRIHPAHGGGFLVEHHHRGGDGFPAGEPEKYVHEDLDGVHEHLDQHLAEHEAQHGENDEAGDTE